MDSIIAFVHVFQRTFITKRNSTKAPWNIAHLYQQHALYALYMNTRECAHINIDVRAHGRASRLRIFVPTVISIIAFANGKRTCAYAAIRATRNAQSCIHTEIQRRGRTPISLSDSQLEI